MSEANQHLDDVVEACADALLSAAAASLGGERVEVHAVVERAQEAIMRVVERTLREGPKPR